MATVALLSAGWQLYSSYKSARKIGRIASSLSRGKMPKASDLASVLFSSFGVDLDLIPDGVIDSALPGTSRARSIDVSQNDVEAAVPDDEVPGFGCDDSRQATSELTQGEVDMVKPVLEEVLMWACETCLGKTGDMLKLSSQNNTNKEPHEMSFEELRDAVFKLIVEWEEYCQNLQKEYDSLLERNVPEDEDAQIEHVENISLVSIRLEAAQMSLAELKSRLSIAALHSALNLGGSLEDGVYAGRSVLEWKDICKKLQQQYDQLINEEIPFDENSQVQHLEELTITSFRLEAAQINLAELHSKLEEAYENVQEEYIELQTRGVSSDDDEDAQVAHCQNLSLVTQRMEKYQKYLVV